jgi:hypothetical protein
MENHPYKIGENYFIRSVTFHYTGRLVAVYPNELVLQDASWVPTDGRFTQAVLSGDLSEVEPYPDGREVIIGRSAVTDAVIVSWPLPRKQK